MWCEAITKFLGHKKPPQLFILINVGDCKSEFLQFVDGFSDWHRSVPAITCCNNLSEDFHLCIVQATEDGKRVLQHHVCQSHCVVDSP